MRRCLLSPISTTVAWRAFGTIQPNPPVRQVPARSITIPEIWFGLPTALDSPEIGCRYPFLIFITQTIRTAIPMGSDTVGEQTITRRSISSHRIHLTMYGKMRMVLAIILSISLPVLMFAYCNDNPVNHVDEDGTFALSSILISAAVSGIVAAISTAVTGGSAGDVWLAAGMAAAFSGISVFFKSAAVPARVFFSLVTGTVAAMTCYSKGGSLGQSLLCGFATSIASFVSSMFSVWLQKDALAAIITELSVGLGLNVSASALGMTGNQSSKNTESGSKQRQSTPNRKQKQSPPRLPYHRLFTYRPEFV